MAARKLARAERRLTLLQELTAEEQERVLRLRAVEALHRPAILLPPEPEPQTPDPLSLADRAPSRPPVSSSPPPELTLVPPEELVEMPDPVEEIARRSGLLPPPT